MAVPEREPFAPAVNVTVKVFIEKLAVMAIEDSTLVAVSGLAVEVVKPPSPSS